MSRNELLRAQAREITPELEKASEIAKKAVAENRNMTAAERSVYDAAVAKAQPVLDALKANRADQHVIGAARELAETIGFPGAPGAAKNGQRLSFKGMASGIAAKMLTGDAMGQKALAPSGAAVVDQEFAGDPIALGKPANSLLAVLPVKQHTTPNFAYLRQTARTNNATSVAEGALKPTSVYSVERVENELKVVAHLSEGTPRYWFVDNISLEQFIGNELDYGLALAVESQTLAAINATSGIQVNAYVTSPLTTLRKSLTKLEITGYTASAFVLAPSDWEAIELALTTVTAVEYNGLPYDPATRRLFGVPVVVTNSQTGGVAHTLADGSVGVDTDTQGVGVQWSETSNADDFSRNLLRARCEGRFATSVFAPLGVVKSALK